MKYKRFIIAICLLAASSVLAQTDRHLTCENCITFSPPSPGTVTLGGPTAQVIIPSPVWVADPSAGHYDCPNGWTAYGRSEPEVFKAGGYAVPASAIYRTPNLDKKGHVLSEQPSPPICIQEKP